MATEHDTAHPTPRMYVRLAIALAVITAIEVGLFYAEDALGAGLTRPMLIGLSSIKFVAVIGWYMHLRFDQPILRRFFTAGFILAGVLYAIVLSSFVVGRIVT